MIPSLDSFRRIVIKVGSSLLVDRAAGEPKRAWLDALALDIAGLHGRGCDVLVVSSGAIALGRTVLGLPRGALKLEDSQGAAAVGQIALARVWAEVLGERRITAGQILLTLGDTEERRRYLNARETLARLLAMRAVPIINENDTVATSEIRYGDNDRLAARVATMASADLLVLLSDIDGLYTAPPDRPGARLVSVVERIDAAVEAMAGGAASDLSRGGMRTKIEAGKIAAAGGTHMVADRPHTGRGTLHLVPDRLDARGGPKSVDRRLAGAPGRAHGRRRGGPGAGEWREPASRRRDAGGGLLRAGRLRAGARSRGRGARPRAGGARPRPRGPDRGPQLARDRGRAGRHRPQRDDPPRRPRAPHRVRRPGRRSGRVVIVALGVSSVAGQVLGRTQAARRRLDDLALGASTRRTAG